MVARDVAKLEPGQIAYGPLTDEEGLMVDDCTVMVRSADSIRFCGANDRDYELFSEKAPEVEVREFTMQCRTSASRGRRAASGCRA